MQNVIGDQKNKYKIHAYNFILIWCFIQVLFFSPMQENSRDIQFEIPFRVHMCLIALMEISWTTVTYLNQMSILWKDVIAWIL